MCLSNNICKMSTILYFAFVVLCGSAVAQDNILQVHFTDTLANHQHGNYYFSVEGGNVTFTCQYSNGLSSVPLNFNKGIRAGKGSCIYSGGMLPTHPPGKYSLTKEFGRVLLNIYNVDEDDSSLYACWYFRKTNPSNARILFNFAHLYVLATHEEPRFCVLVQDTSGVFHPQDDLILRCPIYEISEIKFMDKDWTVQDVRSNLNCEPLDGNFCKMNVTKVTLTLNGTRISCNISNGDDHFDFCRQIPTLIVIDNLVVHVEVDEIQNREGRFALLTCTSFPSLLSSIQWYVEGNNLSILSKNLKFNQLQILNQPFPNATKMNFRVACKITIGKISRRATVNINYTFGPLPPSRGVTITDSSNIGLPTTRNVLPLQTEKTSMAGLDKAMSKTQTTAFTSGMASLSPQSLSLVGIIVPATVIPLLVIVFIILICCFRSSKSATVKRDSSRSGTDNLTRDNNYEDKDSRIQLGLSPENSQVIGNVLYEPYRGNNI